MLAVMITATETPCPTCGAELRTISITNAQPAPYPPITTTFTHPCPNCEVDDG